MHLRQAPVGQNLGVCPHEADRQSHLRDGERVTGRNAGEPTGGLDKE